MTQTKMAEELGRFASSLTFDQIPPDVVEFAKSLVLKTIAGMLAGAKCPNSSKMIDLVRARSLPGEVGVIGTDLRTSIWEGALLNAFSAHASELEDVAIPDGGCSWDVTVIPLLLTLADRLNLSGKALIEATVAGLEVHYRTSLPFDIMRLGQSLPTTSAMGCAAAAARAYGLGPEGITSAMGFALSGPAITEASLGTDAHFLESALHALQGLIGAEMAKMGLTSNPDIASYGEMLSRKVTLQDAMADLGRHWFFTEMWVKKYPNSISIHRQLDALFALMAEHGLSYGDIETVEVVAGVEDQGCDRPDPQTNGDLQFSFQHALGLAMLNGKLKVTDFLAETAQDARLAEAMKKVRVTIVRPDGPGAAEPVRYMSRPTTVNILTRDGRSFGQERKAVFGSPEDPMRREDFAKVFTQYAADHISAERLESTMASVWALETVPDVSVLLRALAA